jgi:predicted GNAT family acetyltransferase
MTELTDNIAGRRFEMAAGGAVAFIAYRRDADRLILVHTEVPQALAGRGIGSRLVQATLDEARRRGLKVVPQCRFVAGFIERHPAYRDLVAAEGD